MQGLLELENLPESVVDSQLDVLVRGSDTVHLRPLACRGDPRPQTWRWEKFLGQGGDGVVFQQKKAEGPGTIDCLAVKNMQLDNSLTSGDHNSRRYVRELQALYKFSQDRFENYFVKYYGWYVESSQLNIVMEYCEHRDLGSYLKELKRGNCLLPEREAQDIARQLLTGLSHMHKNKFAHRDLKPGNILIKRRPPEKWWVVLADLGLSRRDKDSVGSTTVRGSRGFMAPEIIWPIAQASPDSIDSRPADIWCLGETISFALTGRPTFRDDHHLYEFQQNRILFPGMTLAESRVSQPEVQIIFDMMKAEPSLRPTADAALQYSWIINNVERVVINPEPLIAVFPSPSQISHSASLVYEPWTATAPAPLAPTSQGGEWTTTLKTLSANTHMAESGFKADRVSPSQTPIIPPTLSSSSGALHHAKQELTVSEIDADTPETKEVETQVLKSPRTITAPPNSASGESGKSNENSLNSKEKGARSDKSLFQASANEKKPSEKTSGHDLINWFKKFSAGERSTVEERVKSRERERKPIRIGDLKEFQREFKMSTPVPIDLIPIITNNEEKQREIAEKNAEIFGMMEEKSKVDAASKFENISASASRNVKKLEAAPKPYRREQKIEKEPLKKPGLRNQKASYRTWAEIASASTRDGG